MLAVTLAALVAFDVAAVTALRGYLLGQTDQQLQEVLSLYRVLPIRTAAGGQGGAAPPGNVRPIPKQARKVISGPTARLPGPLGQFQVVTVSGRKPTMSIRAGAGLAPELPADLNALAGAGQAVTVPSRNGTGPVRLMAESFRGLGLVYATTSLSGVNQTVGQLELILIFGSAAAGLIAAGGAAWVMRRGLRPIEAMAGQADKINAGDLTDRVSPADPRTEVGRLGAALNGMLARIEDFVAEREASQEATRRFFADASHELRTPLASLRANAELYQQGALPERAPGRRGDAPDHPGGSADGPAGRRHAPAGPADQHPGRQFEPVDLSVLAAECVQRARTASPQRAWRCEITGGVEVTGDEELLRRAIDNVLANVAAHTPAGSTGTLTVTGRDGRAVLAVSDDGPGVPAEQLARIFDRFYRAAGAARRPGSGLGLAIVAAVVAAHDGEVAAAAREPHGLRIALTLPASRPHQPDPGLTLAARVT